MVHLSTDLVVFIPLFHFANFQAILYEVSISARIMTPSNPPQQFSQTPDFSPSTWRHLKHFWGEDIKGEEILESLPSGVYNYL